MLLLGNFMAQGRCLIMRKKSIFSRRYIAPVGTKPCLGLRFSGQSLGLIVNFLVTMKMLQIHVTIRGVISRYSNWV
jgi:hypothetical protein